MTREKIPTIRQMKNWIATNAVSSINGKTGDLIRTDVTKSSTAPSNPKEGDLWIETTFKKQSSSSIQKQQIISLTTSSGQDVNQTTVINWDEHLVSGDSAFSHSTGNSSVSINEAGTYKIYANIYTDTSNSRTNPSFYFRINGSEVAGRSGSSYARNNSGHTHTSTNLEIVRELSPGDSIDIQTFKEANGGTCNLQNRRSIFTIEKMAR